MKIMIVIMWIIIVGELTLSYFILRDALRMKRDTDATERRRKQRQEEIDKIVGFVGRKL